MPPRPSDVQVELDRARAEANAAAECSGGATPSVDGSLARTGGDASDISSEWEEVVPPMDS
jgi:hypothetical protein